MPKYSAIIVAGGSGSRMNSPTPKQYIEVEGKAIIAHTLQRFLDFDPNIELIIVLHKDWQEHFKAIMTEHFAGIAYKITLGGKERFHSVKNGLALCSGQYIAVHDAARPTVSVETISRCFNAAVGQKAVIPVLAATDSLRKITPQGSVAVPRKEYLCVQTPQVFEAELLRTAYEIPFHENLTDDASVVEAVGKNIATVEGNPENIKVTHPSDLWVIKAFLENGKHSQ